MNAETLNKFLTLGVQHGASDIHFRVGAPPAYRVNGALHNLKAERLTPNDTISVASILLRDTDVSKLAMVQEHDTSYSVPGVGRFRANVFRQRGSLSAVLRSIPNRIPTVDELRLPPVVRRLAEEERGMVLVTGATGSGKSTTLAAMVDHVNGTRAAHVLTIEDPIEYLHRNRMATVSQREVGIDTANFTVALRSALRQDPDVILVGEMRDAETIDIALKAAETGHLVYSTVHTTDAAKTIGRLLSVFPSNEQINVRHRIADNLCGTISQRLLLRADGRGRVPACEVMIATKTVRESIRDSERTTSLKEVIERGGQDGMQTFDQHLSQLYRAHAITLESALAAATSPADFERNLSFQ